MKILEAGILEKEKRAQFKEWHSGGCTGLERKVHQTNISLAEAQGAFYILGIGLTVACSMLICEFIYDRRRGSKQLHSHSQQRETFKSIKTDSLKPISLQTISKKQNSFYNVGKPRLRYTVKEEISIGNKLDISSNGITTNGSVKHRNLSANSTSNPKLLRNRSQTVARTYFTWEDNKFSAIRNNTA